MCIYIYIYISGAEPIFQIEPSKADRARAPFLGSPNAASCRHARASVLAPAEGNRQMSAGPAWGWKDVLFIVISR